MIDFKEINIEEYNYNLPEEKIAKYPLSQRDNSKLLVLKDGIIFEKNFFDLPEILPDNSFLVFNDTKVIHARILFEKESGSLIEFFCLEPVSETSDYQLVFQQKGKSIWKCLIGNNKKLKKDTITKTFGNNFNLTAKRIKPIDDAWIVEFYWDSPEMTFAEVIEQAGVIPLPPYIKRKNNENDKITYQTIYAKYEGSVAAPTAGLHFTKQVFEKISEKGINYDKVTLHVGAGTFKPVSSSNIEEHIMHNERFSISKNFIIKLIDNINKRVIAVGTTSTRTLESLYWFGVKLEVVNNSDISPYIEQWMPYNTEYNIGLSAEKALTNVLQYLNINNLDELNGSTQLIIVPGYEYKIIKGLITNFHQPKSTLLLLVSALINNKWKEVYNYALDNNFRFLSYGDSCLFLK